MKPTPEMIPDIPLAQLAEIEQMSVRAYNVCNVAGLQTLEAILDHYRRVGTFAKLRNAGRLTEEELVGICTKYESRETPALIEEQLQTEPELNWGELTPTQMTAIERYFLMRLDALSVRAQGLLKYIVPRIDTSAAAFAEFFGERKHRQPGSFQNVGRVTITELVTLRDDLVQLARTVRDGLAEQAIFSQFVEQWVKEFGFEESELLHYRQGFIVRRFPLFRFMHDLFERGRGLGERDLMLMRHRYPYYLGAEKVTLEELASRLDLTRERVRQLSVAIPSKLRAMIASIGPISDFVNYEALYGRSRDLLVIDEEFAECINAREGVSFVSPFYSTIFESFLKESHDRIEEDFDATTDYLVSRELREVFDFDAYLRDLAERIEARRPEDYTLSMREHPKRFWSGEDYSLLPRVAAVCEVLAHEEFGIHSTAEGDLIFIRNTKRRMHEFIIDYLEEIGRPMHVEEMFEALKERHPGLVSSVESLRGTMLRYDRFRRYEASSTYGLKEWEEQYAHLKSGSYSDIAERYLQEFDHPRHITEVADHVMQYRSTNRPNVIYTLKADVTERFKFFDGGMIGLTKKDYSSTNTNFRPLSGRVFDSLARLIRDNGNSLSLTRLMDYSMLHYRMPEEQARSLFERAFREGRLELDGDKVSVPEVSKKIEAADQAT